MTYRFKYF